MTTKPEQIELAYGQTGLSVSLPPQCSPTIIRKPPLKAAGDGASQIEHALQNPIGSDRLEALAAKASTACILICDITRPVPNGLFLRPVIERLMAAGVPADGITVLVATGLHRPNLDDELEEVLGDPWVQKNVRVENHYARDEAAQVHLGHTNSGGRKVIAPGVAHHETIRTFHSARFMESEFATSCNLVNNPLHETQLEIIEMLEGPVLGLNTVLDEHRNLVFTSFGDIIDSHLAAVAFARDSCEVAVGRKFKTIVTSSAGYPLDKTYYQTVKGMVTPLDILEPGGELIIVSECSEGFGSAEFRAAQDNLVEMGPQGFLASIESKSLADIDEWQTEMQLKPMRIGKISLYSPGLDAKDQKSTGVEIIGDVHDAITGAIARQRDTDVAFIPEGPYVVPFARA